MKEIEDYLAGEFKKSKEIIEAGRLSLAGVTKLFEASFFDKPYAGWPYEWGQSDPKPPAKPSISTLAMCIAAVNELLTYWRRHEGEQISHETIKTLEAHKTQSFETILNTVPKGWVSSTFGKNDIFTASWVACLIDDKTNTDTQRVLTEIICRPLLNSGFENDSLLAGPDNKSNTAGAHALPLLRLVGAAAALQKQCPTFVGGHEFYRQRGSWKLRKKSADGATIKTVQDVIENGKKLVGRWFEQTLDRQLAFERFKNARFDAAELVFCLKGAIQTGSLTRDQKVFTDVLEVVRQAQARSVYWRPYRPMVSTPQGMVLLPISVEVANCLLWLLFEPDWPFDKAELFANYRDTLDKYFQWQESQRYPKHDGPQREKAHGWHSENAYETDRIHIWTTSQVAIFLIHYLNAVETDIKAKLLSKSGFTLKRSNDIQIKWDELIAFDEGIVNNIKTKLETHFINPRLSADRPVVSPMNSLLLHGPPGTAKTTVAQAVASRLGWPLVYLTPSDFLYHGEQMVEAAARQIFNVLTELTEVVIFFDEIDRLILDRDLADYGKQGEIFQFMTPSMLAKLTDLSDAKKSIFIIATNFAERIDKAIKRPGRIDLPLLCLPYNLKARTRAIAQVIQKIMKPINNGKDVSFTPEQQSKILEIAKKTTLTTHPELKRLIGNVAFMLNIRDVNFLSEVLDGADQSAMNMVRSLSPASIDKRLQPPPDEKTPEAYLPPPEPLMEKIGQLLVEAEVEKSGDIKDRVLTTWDRLVKAVNQPSDLRLLRLYLSEWIEQETIEWKPDEVFKMPLLQSTVP